MTYRNIIHVLFAFGLFNICISCANSNDGKLRDYYTSNTQLHQELSDSLMSFCKKYNTDVKLEKTQYAERSVIFRIHFHDSAELLPVYFDTSFVRHDYKPHRTGNFIIPKTVIEKFKRSIYFGIGSDSTYTFFAYEWDKPKNLIGTSGDSQYGIFVSTDSVKLDNPKKRLSKNTCIGSYGVF